MTVIVAGAGIAGLAVAIALAKAGHAVEVAERADSPGEVSRGSRPGHGDEMRIG